MEGAFKEFLNGTMLCSGADTEATRLLLLRTQSEALPAFNSMAVESQFPNIETVADTIAYLCDDMFYMK